MKHLFATLGVFVICMGLVMCAVGETAEVIFYSDKTTINFVENASVVIDIAEVSKAVVHINETPAESVSVIFVDVPTTSDEGKVIIYLPYAETENEDAKVVIVLPEYRHM